MFDPSVLLGSILQGGMRGPTSMRRLDHAMGERGLGGQGGPLGQILGQLGGGSAGGAHAAGGGDILGQLSRSLGGGGTSGGFGGGGGFGTSSGFGTSGGPTSAGGLGRSGGLGSDGGLGGVLGGILGGGGHGSGYGGSGRSIGRDLAMGGLGALATAILSGRGRGMGGGLGGGLGSLAGGNMRGAMGAGGLVLLGMLAMRALRNAGQNRTAGFADMSGGTGNPVDELPEASVSQDTAALVLRAMIDAAKADGRIDATERQRITAKLQESGADQEELAFLEAELQRPADSEALATAARDPVVAAQVYAASLLAIEVDTPAEQAYLRNLADRLGLDSAVVTQLHQALGAPMP